MKKYKKTIVCILVIFTLLCNGVFNVFAAQKEEMAQPYGPVYSDIIMVDMLGNQYGRTDWPSLSAAKDRYGWDFNYSSCSCYYSGLYFNYYYDFDDGTKMFFGVKM